MYEEEGPHDDGGQAEAEYQAEMDAQGQAEAEAAEAEAAGAQAEAEAKQQYDRDVSLAKSAYTAFSATCGGRLPNGKLLPLFEDLCSETVGTWIAAVVMSTGEAKSK